MGRPAETGHNNLFFLSSFLLLAAVVPLVRDSEKKGGTGAEYIIHTKQEQVGPRNVESDTCTPPPSFSSPLSPFYRG